MRKIVRILNIRMHKFSTFIDAYEKLGKRLELVCKTEIVKKYKLSVGDIIDFNFDYTINKYHKQILEILSINWHNKAICWHSTKGGKNTSSATLSKLQFDARNAGKQLQLLQSRLKAISLIKELLISLNFIEVNCKSIEDKRTSAKRKTLTVNSVHTSSPLYLRITMENQLKQYCAILLHSVFSIDTVFYDKNVTPNIDREVCILELVSIEHSIEDLINLIINIDQILRNVFNEFHLSEFDYTIPSDITIMEYTNYNNSYNKNQIMQNLLLTNVPVNSPFVKASSNNIKTEFEWFVNGKMLAHGYEDEFAYENIINSINNQKEELDIQTCNEMDYIKYAVPRTTSLGIGIDQLLYRFWNIEHIVNISNPIGLYFE